MRKTLLIALLVAGALVQPALAKGPAGAYFGEPVSAMVSVSFANGSTAFRPSPDQVAMLHDLQDAAMVTISGRTSTNQASARDEALALARAVSARAWLVARGVSPLKIMVNYASATDYLTENATPEGRYVNQRVDIEVFYVPRY